MAHRIVPASDVMLDPIEYRDIHLASCRYRKQELACSTCYELVERAARFEAKLLAEAA